MEIREKEEKKKPGAQTRGERKRRRRHVTPKEGVSNVPFTSTGSNGGTCVCVEGGGGGGGGKGAYGYRGWVLVMCKQLGKQSWG